MNQRTPILAETLFLKQFFFDFLKTAKNVIQGFSSSLAEKAITKTHTLSAHYCHAKNLVHLHSPMSSSTSEGAGSKDTRETSDLGVLGTSLSLTLPFRFLDSDLDFDLEPDRDLDLVFLALRMACAMRGFRSFDLDLSLEPDSDRDRSFDLDLDLVLSLDAERDLDLDFRTVLARAPLVLALRLRLLECVGVPGSCSAVLRLE
jgi:hypothetical protein